ncbi:winged helix-turn-helix domain-containing protein [Haliea sp. E1-2-M8]|uniref:winged helix-turn-helix domain-containing tetratricopeptide repeat protein n=1 Tax=Haliea sp. E1-2-M8 TaxID=3064706 RepID=UPI00271BB523|nr:winged helix-turn-helix domain-containing protein [Haliea sp. E1-2-M8]MDO8861637.1 winged helix-turn-helix domain-containing protein [Haliea sp. E1-2-M8]
MNATEAPGATSQAFGHWRFDASTGDLSDGTTTQRLEPQVAKLLDYFLAHQEKLISRDDLLGAVWGERIVSDDAINRCISILRQKLTPDDRNAYIETVVRRGFISHFPPPLEDEAPAQRPQRRERIWLRVGLLAGLVALVIFGAIRMFEGSFPAAGNVSASATPIVAVLPFSSAGLKDDGEFFANGVHDDLLTQLAQLESIHVISRTSVSEYRNSERNIREIGRELGANAILEGSVQRVGDQIRINVQLIDALSDGHLWAQQYDRELTPTNIFAIQAEIARSVAAALNSTLTRQDVAGLNVLPTDNMAAYRAYHEAVELRETQVISSPAYIAAMERAVELDPGFVRAWAELAGSLSFLNFRRPDPDSILRLEQILEQIRALAPKSSEYLIAQAYYTYYILKDNDRAYELISRARALRPSDVQVLDLQSWIQRRQGDYDGMLESIRQGQSLDPRSHYWALRLPSNLIILHRYDEAIEVLENTSLESLGLAALRSTMRVREHREPGRMLGALKALEQEYGETVVPLRMWEAHIAARDYQGALALLDGYQEAGRSTRDWTFTGLPDVNLARIITHRLQGGSDSMSPSLPEARARVEGERDAGKFNFAPNYNLAMAMIASAEGNTEETEHLVRTWLREATQDLAELANQRNYACRTLAMAEAAVTATLECLRSALEEPSRVMPFIEPYLPYYDSIREDTRFIEFFADRNSA